MSQRPYRYSEDPALNSGLVPGRDVEEEKATSTEERDAPYRIPLNRPVPPYDSPAQTAPKDKAWVAPARHA
jgi:hypothetical protein